MCKVLVFSISAFIDISRTIRQNWRFGQSLFENLSLRGFAVWIEWPTRISDWKFLKANTVHYTMLCCLTLLYTLLETPACRGVILVVGTEEWALALNSDQPHFFSLVTSFYSFFFFPFILFPLSFLEYYPEIVVFPFFFRLFTSVIERDLFDTGTKLYKIASKWCLK